MISKSTKYSKKWNIHFWITFHTLTFDSLHVLTSTHFQPLYSWSLFYRSLYVTSTHFHVFLIICIIIIVNFSSLFNTFTSACSLYVTCNHFCITSKFVTLITNFCTLLKLEITFAHLMKSSLLYNSLSITFYNFLQL